MARYLIVFFIFMFVGGSTKPNTTLDNEQRSFFEATHPYAPWFDGVRFDHDGFIDHYRNNNLDNNDLLQIYLYLDRLGGGIIFPHSTQLMPEEIQALSVRNALTRSLIKVKNKKDFVIWRNQLFIATQSLTKKFSLRQKQRFYVFLGLGESVVQEQKIYDTYLFNGNIRLTSDRNATKASVYPIRVLGLYTPYIQHNVNFYQNSYARNTLSLSKIKNEMKKAGLMGLKLPLGSVRNQQDLNNISGQISFLNQAMSKRTGFDHALGMKGRIMWFLDKGHQDTVDAYSMQLRPDLIFIQSTWASFPHEWFHGFSWLMADMDKLFLTQKNTKNIKALEKKIKYHGLSAKQWKKLMKEASLSSDAFLNRHWGFGAYPFKPKNTTEALQYSFNKASSPFDAAVSATHVYWLRRPGTYKELSSWVGRRRLLQDIINEAQWKDQNGVIGQEYYTLPSEWMAASFHGDIVYYIDGQRPIGLSLIKIPLETEIQSYKPFWDNFFAESKKTWDVIPEK